MDYGNNKDCSNCKFNSKSKLASDSNEARVWEFLQASFSQNPRQAFATLLGFSPEEISAKASHLKSPHFSTRRLIIALYYLSVAECDPEWQFK